MHVIIAPDSFKGTLTARQAAEAMERGVRAAVPDAVVDLLPIADGGEGMIDVILAARSGERRSARVTGPLGGPVDAEFALIDEGATAIVESAAAIGLTLVRNERCDPLMTTSYGLGELIVAAVETGARRIVVGLGGSSTNDGGVGMAQALGVGVRGVPIPARGGQLEEVIAIDPSSCADALAEVQVIVACDVDNPLLGPTGATRTYGPQKGATNDAIEQLERGLAHVSSLLPEVDPRQPGMGAAGGLGFGLTAFCHADIVAGADLVLDLLELERRLDGVDLVLTGEGRMDAQSIHGKACIALARRAGRAGIPVVAIVGSAGPGVEAVREHGICDWFVTSESAAAVPDSAEARQLLEAATANAMKQAAP